MRFDTYNAGAHLIHQLVYSGAISRVVHDGGDIILVEIPSGESIAIYLIERSIPLYEIEAILADNSQNNIHTLFVLWCDMLLPNDGQWFMPPDWMLALLTLYGDQIYGFDTFGREVFLFPVYFEGEGAYRFIRHGVTVNVRNLHCKTARTNVPGLQGFWRAAGFVNNEDAHSTNGTQPRTHLQLSYEFLGLDRNATLEVIKQSYRALARQYHPDLSDAANATLLMQQLNEAYENILRHLGE